MPLFQLGQDVIPTYRAATYMKLRDIRLPPSPVLFPSRPPRALIFALETSHGPGAMVP